MDIAIIGMAIRAPGARDLDEFWTNLEAGRESISRFSDDELAQAGVDPALLRDPAYVPAAPVLNGSDLFDAAFFGYTPREAAIIDPQQRVLLECAWEALEHAGYDPHRCGRAVGVFAGASMNTYLLYSGLLPQLSREYVLTLSSSDKDFVATRISYKLNLRGPALTVQTACSTSLVAVHLACQSLRLGECDMALAGGVAVKVPQTTGYLWRPGGLLSSDGHVRAFDAGATGTVFGSGAGIVVLKPMASAIRDRDFVYAVIRGSAVNNDGSAKASFTAPSVGRQADVVVEALANADVEPDTISYVETHGTGTPLGDPIEIAALTAAFRSGTARCGFCAVGSLKTNVGHLEAASGIAGLIKATLALHHRYIPPSLHYEEPNPDIDFARSPFYVAARGMAWPSGVTARRAGVSALGVGGTNVHVVIEEAPAEPVAAVACSPQLLVISARTEAALQQVRTSLAARLERAADGDLAAAAYTLQVGRKRFDVRDAVVCGDRADAVRRLRAPGRPRTAARRPPCHLAFICTGETRAWTGEAVLFGTHPRFRQQIIDGCRSLKPHLNLEIDPSVWTDRAARQRTAARVGEPRFDALTAVIAQVALASLWESWGIRPRVLVGVGVGEVAAECVAGRLSRERALARLADAGSDATTPAADLPLLKVFSTATGTWTEDEVGGPQWMARVNGTPRCAGSLRALGEEPLVFVELGSLSETTRGVSDASVCLSSLPSDQSTIGAVDHMLATLGELWIEGADVDWHGVQGGCQGRRLALPTYPFDRKRFWVEESVNRTF